MNREVPRYKKKEFSERKSSYCIVVFVINEGDRIRSQLAKMKPYSDQVDIIIADGGSTDGSLDEAYLREQGVRVLLIKTETGKLGSQMRIAFAYALDQGYKGVIVMDGNNKDDPGPIPQFIKALEEGMDHVQGSRYIHGGVAINTPWLRHWAVKLIHAPLIRSASGFRYTDTTNGFRAYSKLFLNNAGVDPFRKVFSDYELHYYLAIRAARLKFKVREVPVTRAYPKSVPAPTKISFFKGNFNVLKLLFLACFGYYNPKNIQK